MLDPLSSYGYCHLISMEELGFGFCSAEMHLLIGEMRQVCALRNLKLRDWLVKLDPFFTERKVLSIIPQSYLSILSEEENATHGRGVQTLSCFCKACKAETLKFSVALKLRL